MNNNYSGKFRFQKYQETFQSAFNCKQQPTFQTRLYSLDPTGLPYKVKKKKQPPKWQRNKCRVLFLLIHSVGETFGIISHKILTLNTVFSPFVCLFVCL